MNSWWLSLKENIQISYSDNKFWFDYFSRKFHSLNHIAWYNCFIINSSASFCCKVRKRRIGIQLHNKPQVKCQYCCTHVGEPTNYFISHNCPHNSALKKKKKSTQHWSNNKVRHHVPRKTQLPNLSPTSTLNHSGKPFVML